jgi:hypothetical protein
VDGRAVPGQTTATKPRDIYEQNAEQVDPNLANSRFMKYYGMQKNEFGFEDGKAEKAQADAEKWVWEEFKKKFPNMSGPKKFGSRYHRFIHKRMENQKRDRRLEGSRHRRFQRAVVHGMLSIGTFLSVIYDTDAGWRGLLLLATIAVFVGLVLPIFLLLVFGTWLYHKWNERNRKKEHLLLMAKYGNDEDERELQRRLEQTPQERIKRIKAVREKQGMWYDDLLYLLGLKKRNPDDSDTIIGGLVKHVEIEPGKEFNPKEFLQKKFPHFQWTKTGPAIDPSRLTPDEAVKLNRQLSGYPLLDSAKLQDELLEIQKTEVRRIRDEGPKGMLDFMVARLHSEQDELRLDRDVVSMNIERVVDLVKNNMMRYKAAVRTHRPGHVLQLYEETIESQRIDLDALRDELAVIDERGWEIKRRLEVLQQSLHNAVYSNLNGIEHPVVNDIIASDLQQVLLGHIPTDLVDQKKLFDFASLLAPLQQQLVRGEITLEKAKNTLLDDFGYFFPNPYDFNTELPDISQLSQQNVSNRAPYKIQHVLEPLVDSGPATKKLIEIAVLDFEAEFENKFEEFDINSDAKRVKRLQDAKKKHEQEIWDNSTYLERAQIKWAQLRGTDDDNQGNKSDEMGITAAELHAERQADLARYEVQAIKYKQLREESLREREDRQLRYETTHLQFDPALRRQLGAFGKDHVGNAKKRFSNVFDVPAPANSENMFLKDGSYVGGYDEELQQERKKYTIDYLLQQEKEKEIELAKQRQDEILATAKNDPRLVHQLETDRIAFGTPMMTAREETLQRYKKFDDFVNKIPFFREEGYGTKAYNERLEAMSQASPEFWSGSMFQERVANIKPIDTTNQHLGKTFMQLIGFKPTDEDYEFNNLDWLSNDEGTHSRGWFGSFQWLPSMLSKDDIEKAGDVALRKSIGQQETMYQRFIGTVTAAKQSKEILDMEEKRYGKAGVDFDGGFEDGFSGFDKQNGYGGNLSTVKRSHWNKTGSNVKTNEYLDQNDGSRSKDFTRHRKIAIDNSYLDLDPSKTPAIPDFGPVSKQIKMESRSLVEKIRDGVNEINKPGGNQNGNNVDAIPAPKTHIHTKKAKSDQDIDKKWSSTFPEMSQTLQNDEYDPKKAALATQSSPLLALPEKPQPQGFFSRLFSPSTPPSPPLPPPSKQLDKDGFSPNQWSIGFDDVKKVESQSQMYILKSLVHEDDKKRVEKWFGDNNTTSGSFQENVKYPQIGEKPDNEPSYDGLINRRDQKLWDEQQRKMKLEQEAMDKQQDEKLQEQYRQSVSIDGLKKSNKPISRGW